MMLASCGGTKDAGQNGTLIERSDIKIEGKRMTPEALWAMGRIGSVAVSPDEKQIAYSVAYYSVPENKSNNELFVMNADGSSNRQITRDSWQESQPVWIKDGKKIAFLCNESGSSQVWEMNPDGTERKQLTRYEGDIEGFAFSPDGKKLLFIAQVKTVQSTADKHPDLPKATGIIVTDLMYKHWDEWVTTAPHPFVADFDGNGISNVQDILDGEPYESPMKPWGGIEQLAWSPASDKVAYTCRKKTGLAYAVSTNSDIYIYDLATGKTENITEENKGYDTNPQYSPDGKYIAWQSMERDGYEADLNRLFVMDLATGEKRFVSRAFESNVDAFLWNKDSQSIYFIGVWHGETQIYNIGLADNDSLNRLTDGMHDYASLALCGDKLIAKRHSMSMGDEIYAVNNTRSGNAFAKAEQLTFENKQIYDQLALVSGGPKYNDEAGIYPKQSGNEELSWEQTWSNNIGLRLGFFNRVNLDIDFYHKKTTDMLMSVPESYAITGEGYRWDNIGAMVNRGVEVSVNSDIIRTKDFTWNLNANVSYNKNKLVELYNGVQEYVNSTTGLKFVVGHPVHEFFLNRYAGVNPANGDALWYTKDGELTTEFNESDKVMTGKKIGRAHV